MSLLDTLADLIRIPSVNPNYGEETSEAAVADYVEQFFAARGIETFRQSVLPGRDNVIAKLPGRDPDRRIVLEAHMDTVSTAGMSIEPFDPIIREGRMFGRGACDTKGGMAAMMHALARLKQRSIEPACEVWFAATIDEEFSYRGVVELCDSLRADAAVRAHAAMVAEPTELQPVTASKGLVRFRIETIGRAAHSAKPHLGINAIEAMSRIVCAMEQHNRSLQSRQHTLLGPPTCNVGVIRGGVQINLVPPSCEIEVDRRILPGETVDGVLNDYDQLVRSLDLHPAQVVVHPPLLTDLPLETDIDSAPVRSLQNILREEKLDSTPIGVPFCSDASKFGAIGIPAIIFGPGSIDQAHSADEFVECEQVQTAAKIYEQFLLEGNSVFLHHPPAGPAGRVEPKRGEG